jgi:hypothetical protein
LLDWASELLVRGGFEQLPFGETALFEETVQGGGGYARLILFGGQG